MRIVLFAHNLKMAGGLSVGRNLINSMLEVAPMHEYLIVIPSEADYPDYGRQDNVEVLKCPPMPLLKRHFWERKTLRKAIAEFGPDWIWSLGNVPISHPPCRQSLLIHNPNLVYPQKQFGISCPLSIRLNIRAQQHFINKGLSGVNHVHCQTDVMRRRFCGKFRFPYDRTLLCKTPISPYFFEDVEFEEPEIFKTYADRFKLLYVTFGSGYGGSKNLGSIVDMYSRYREELSETVCFLTIDKKMEDQSRSICERIEEENLDDLIVPIGTVPFEQTRNYYHFADAYFFPSKLETLGLPHWEAMASGLPVIASDLDFAHEICGDAAMFVDPFSLSSMKDGILRMMQDPALREDLIRKGHAQLKSVVSSWPDSVRQVLVSEGIEHISRQ